MEHHTANEILWVQMETVTGVKNRKKKPGKKKKDLTTCAKITTHRHGHSKACVYTDINISACKHTHTNMRAHTQMALRQLTAFAPRPQVQWWPLLQPHLPLSSLILLVGSIICLAVWVPVSSIPGDSQAMGAWRHWAEASPASAAAVWETERGAAQMWESGANRRYGWFQRRPCLLLYLFLRGRSRPLIWLTAKHLAFVPEMNNCKEDEARGEKRGWKGKETWGQRRNPVTRCRVSLVILYPIKAEPRLQNTRIILQYLCYNSVISQANVNRFSSSFCTKTRIQHSVIFAWTTTRFGWLLYFNSLY